MHQIGSPRHTEEEINFCLLRLERGVQGLKSLFFSEELK